MLQHKTFQNGIEVVGGGLIESPDQKILLTRSPKWNNKWTMPGGHIEPGESIEQATIRECSEETGLNLKSLGILTYGELINSKDFHRPAHFIYFDFYLQSKNKNVILENRELTEYVWMDAKEALNMDLAESFDKTILRYLEVKK